jgi:hypothetical protein
MARTENFPLQEKEIRAMKPKDIVAWIDRRFTGLHRPQRLALGALAWGLMRGGKWGVCAVGRAMETATTPKHNIKRVWRFVSNAAVDAEAGMRVLAEMACAGKTRVVFPVDWTDLGSEQMIKAGAAAKGRTLPVAWAVGKKGTFRKSMNAWEKGFFVMLRGLLPEETKGVVVADRGFGRAALGPQLEALGLEYVLRVKGKVTVETEGYRGLLQNVPLRRGQAKDLGWVKYRGEKGVRTRVVCVWERGKKEPWYLMTNVEDAPRKVGTLYAKRMQVEEWFKDGKGVRRGFQMRGMRLKGSARYERMMLVLAVAYWMLVLIGWDAERQGKHRQVLANTMKRRVMSLFQVGYYYLARWEASCARLFTLIPSLIFTP